jgi:uncharacterized protein YdeI (YjbR/CyaY-like superfamily)
MAKKNPKVEWYFAKEEKWKKEYAALRTIALGCGLDEVLKWGCACYALDGANVVLIHGFKDYCAYLFFKGALLKDPKKLLIQQTANVQSARQIRFTKLADITKRKAALKAYIQEAIKVEKSGAKVEMKKASDFKVAAEFQSELDRLPALKRAFEGLTPGRQKAYLLYFSSAKQSKTRVERVEKFLPKILDGMGMDD